MTCDIQSGAWGPGVIKPQLLFCLPFLGIKEGRNTHCWRCIGIKPWGRKKCRGAGQKIWVTGKGGVSSRSLIILILYPPSHAICTACFFNTQTRPSICRGDGDSCFQAEPTCFSPYTCLFAQRTVISGLSKFSRSIPGIYEVIFFMSPWASFVSSGLERETGGCLSSSDLPTSLHVLDKCNVTLHMKVEDWLSHKQRYWTYSLLWAS